MGPHVVTDPEVVASSTTDWTGRFVGHSPAVVRPGSTEEVAGVVAVCRELGLAAGAPGREHRPGRRRRSRSTVRWSSPLGGWPAWTRSTRPAGQVTVGAGVTLAASQPGGARGRLVLRRGHRQPPVGHRGRDGGHQRRRPARPPLRGHPGPGDRASRRCWGPGRWSPTWPDWSRTTPATTGPAWCAAARGPWPWSPGPVCAWWPRLDHRTVALLAFGSVPDAIAAGRPASAGRSPPWRRASWCWPRGRAGGSVTGVVPALRRAPPGLPAGGGGRPVRSHRCPGRSGRLRPTGSPMWPWPPSRPGGPSSGTTASPTPWPSTPWGRRTSWMSPSPTGRWPSSSTGYPAVVATVDAGRPYLAVRPRRGRQHPRQRDRPRPRRRPGGRCRAPTGGRARGQHQRRARHRHGQAAVAAPVEVGGRAPAFRSIKSALDPDGILNPEVLLAAAGS